MGRRKYWTLPQLEKYWGLSQKAIYALVKDESVQAFFDDKQNCILIKDTERLKYQRNNPEAIPNSRRIEAKRNAVKITRGGGCADQKRRRLFVPARVFRLYTRVQSTGVFTIAERFLMA